jgi:hypothetical protein
LLGIRTNGLGKRNGKPNLVIEQRQHFGRGRHDGRIEHDGEQYDGEQYDGEQHDRQQCDGQRRSIELRRDGQRGSNRWWWNRRQQWSGRFGWRLRWRCARRRRSR